MKFTVLGGNGFIGSYVVTRLKQLGINCDTPPRSNHRFLNENLGYVIYAIGVTADFRTRPFDTIRAHVCVLNEILERGMFDSLVYLSSTRVYASSGVTREEAPLTVKPQDPDQLYNASKIAGEALCAASGRDNVKVARLSNVYGDDVDSQNFLSSLIRSARSGCVHLDTALASSKDYIPVEQAAELLVRIAQEGRQVVYNIASGSNMTHAEIMTKLSEMTGCRIEVSPDAPTTVFPVIDVNRIKEEFSFGAESLMDHLPTLVRQYSTKER